MKILVTGARGMIGSCLVKGLLAAGYSVVGMDRGQDAFTAENYSHICADLGDAQKLADTVRAENPDRIIHLAGLAHASDTKKYTWEDYKHLNVDCTKNVLSAAGDIPVLFISTVDVYGFASGTVNAATPPKPVSHYAQSKMLAEQEVSRIKHYDIFRFSPVYTDAVRRDIQKRYYLKYPNIAYRIGKGTEYEILNAEKAVSEMVGWCSEEPRNAVRVLKDDKRMWTPDYIAAEKRAGRAKVVVFVPVWAAACGYALLKGVTGENKYTYLLNKAVHPLRTR